MIHPTPFASRWAVAARALLWLSLLSVAAVGLPAAVEAPLILQSPSVSQTQIAFVYAGYIWTVPRAGGDARRIVDSGGRSGGPIFSPDGSQIAYTNSHDGNADVYVVNASGGTPKRLTYHPGTDLATGWTPDGKRVVFASARVTTRDLPQLFTISVNGGQPEELPLPSGSQASFSPDGTHLAYVPFIQWQPEWKMYRGGQTTPIWIADLADSSVVKIPRENSNDRCPMWVGDSVYFISDREGRYTLFGYDTKTAKVKKLLANDGFDIKSASAGAGAIVYSQFDSIHLFDLATGKSQRVNVRIADDFAELAPHFDKIKAHEISNAAISPTGKRAVFEARGEIFSVPAEKGDARDLTHTPGVAERDPSWSPDGKTIAYFSDESGEYALHLRSPDGLVPARKIDLGQPPSFFYAPHWSPDSSKIAYTDKRLKLWYVDVESGKPAPVDADLYDSPLNNLNVSWSPDSQWLVYTKLLANHLHAVFVYSIADHSTHQVTDGLSDAGAPRFDRNGKYLYFTASTQTALAAGWLDMSAIDRPVTASVYAAVLQKGVASPVAPQSDEEGDDKSAEKEKSSDEKKSSDKPKPDGDKSPKPEPLVDAKAAGDSKASTDAKTEKAEKSDASKPAGTDAAKPKVEPVRIDFDGLDQRIVSMPLPAANYIDLATGKDGILFSVTAPTLGEGDPGPFGPPLTVARFDLKTRKTDPIADGVSRFIVSADGEKILVRKGDKWIIRAADKDDGSGKGTLATDKLEAYIEPRAVWRQVYREVYRIERDFFYDPNHHGLDLAAAERLYAPFVDGIASRNDLNALLGELTGWIVAGHTWAGGGAQPELPRVSVGLLGADFVIENGHYRIAKIYPGENWNPDLSSPLTRPGVRVNEGDYLLAVNGREVTTDVEVFRFFQETADKQTVVRVASKPDGKDAHDETVVPIGSEQNLRYRAWIESNRRKVDELSGGKLAYVHIPDTGDGGYKNFNRYFFAQLGKQGAILDERFNHGGLLADYIVELLHRPVRMLGAGREGEDAMEPAQAIHGPKVMLINEMSGSGGDALPWIFRTMKAGTIVGKRTWGGLIGIGGYPSLIDGGSITAPRWALYGVRGEWEVENHGIAPDVEVEMDPKLVRQGHDPQLERAVAIALEELAKNPPPKFQRPPYPNYRQKLPGSP